MEKTVFEKMGGKYKQQRDYRLLCLTLPAEEEQHFGIWGQRRRQYLKEHHRILYRNLLTVCKLNDHAHLDYNSKLSSADAMVNGLKGALGVIS